MSSIPQHVLEKLEGVYLPDFDPVLEIAAPNYGIAEHTRQRIAQDFKGEDTPVIILGPFGEVYEAMFNGNVRTQEATHINLEDAMGLEKLIRKSHVKAILDTTLGQYPLEQVGTFSDNHTQYTLNSTKEPVKFYHPEF